MIFVPIWPKNDIRLEEHDFSNFLFFPDRLTIPDEADHENEDDADCDIVMKMKQAGAKNFFS